MIEPLSLTETTRLQEAADLVETLGTISDTRFRPPLQNG